MLKRIWDQIKIQDGDSAHTVSRKQRYLKWGLGTLGVCLLFFMQAGLKKVSAPIPLEEKPKKVVLGDLVDSQDVWAARLEGEAAKIKEIAENLEKQNKIQEKRIKILEESFLLKVQELSEKKESSPRNPAESSIFLDQIPETKIDFSEDPKENASQTPILKPKKMMHLTTENGLSSHATSYVAAGSYAKAVLTSGVVVSTATATVQNPQPIMMRLSEGGNMPRGFKSCIKDAVIIGSCYGDLSSERALCRLHKLSLIEKGGRVVERSVEGWIIGEDGAPGLRGKVVDKAGSVAREAFLSGILSGLSNFLKFEAQTSVYPISPFGQTNALGPKDALKSGVGQGASSALEKLADFSIKRAESMQPVIVVNPGRMVDVVFKEGFDLKFSENQNVAKKIQTANQQSGVIHE